MGNTHLVEVTSQPREDQPELLVDVWTSLGQTGQLRGSGPVVVYVGLWLGARAVSGARVTCLVEGRDPMGLPLTPHTLELRDGGAGDPDITEGDGVYSKYFTQLQSAGRYSLQVTVTSTADRTAYTLGSIAANGTRRHRELGPFTRLVQGTSFSVTQFPTNWSSSHLPPSRILDLSVSVLTSSQKLEFRWSAPGADYDEGRPTSYQLYISRHADQFRAGLPAPASKLLVESFSGVRAAGGSEAHRVTVGQEQVGILSFFSFFLHLLHLVFFCAYVFIFL